MDVRIKNYNSNLSEMLDGWCINHTHNFKVYQPDLSIYPFLIMKALVL